MPTRAVYPARTVPRQKLSDRFASGRHIVAIAIIALGVLLLLVLGVLIWSTRLRPTKFKLTLKLWKLIHLELESETRGTSRRTQS